MFSIGLEQFNAVNRSVFAFHLPGERGTTSAIRNLAREKKLDTDQGWTFRGTLHLVLVRYPPDNPPSESKGRFSRLAFKAELGRRLQHGIVQVGQSGFDFGKQGLRSREIEAIKKEMTARLERESLELVDCKVEYLGRLDAPYEQQVAYMMNLEVR